MSTTHTEQDTVLRTNSAGLALTGALALGTAALLPVGSIEDGPILCPFRLLTGVPCPLCGMTRSWVYLAHGDVEASVTSHPVGPLLMAFTALVVVVAVIRWVRGSAFIADRWLVRAAVVLGIVTCIFGVGRWVHLAMA